MRGRSWPATSLAINGHLIQLRNQIDTRELVRGDPRNVAAP